MLGSRDNERASGARKTRRIESADRDQEPANGAGFLVGVELKTRKGPGIGDSLEELSELAITAGGEVVGDGLQKMATPCAATFIGKGKAEEFAGIAAARTWIR